MNASYNPRSTSNYGNPYLFTGRRVDILDNGSLKIQYNRNRYYDYYTGRWLTHDPLGINPAGGPENPFGILVQYLDALSLYEYVGSNPIIFMDPLGLFKVDRSGGAKAWAEAEEGDTIRTLADFIGLEADEWRAWLTFPGDQVCTRKKGLISVSKLTVDTEFCPGETVKIPNTVMAYWAGILGGFGKMWVAWDEDIRRLEKRGFNVPEVQGLTAAGLEAKIASLQQARELDGIFAWGHGRPWYFQTLDTGRGSTYASFYSEWAPAYHMALGIVWACYFQDGDTQTHFSQSPAVIFDGGKGLLIPWPFHLFGQWTDQIVGPGEQGTKP